MIYLCTFKNIVLFISGDRFESPFSKCLREGFKYREIAIISSLRCISVIISTMEKEVLCNLNTAITAEGRLGDVLEKRSSFSELQLVRIRL